jgi:hypothetical protein
MKLTKLKSEPQNIEYRMSKDGIAPAAHTSRKRLTLRGRLRRVSLNLFLK